jgi:hypothetical protein
LLESAFANVEQNRYTVDGEIQVAIPIEIASDRTEGGGRIVHFRLKSSIAVSQEDGHGTGGCVGQSEIRIAVAGQVRNGQGCGAAPSSAASDRQSQLSVSVKVGDANRLGAGSGGLDDLRLKCAVSVANQDRKVVTAADDDEVQFSIVKVPHSHTRGHGTHRVLYRRLESSVAVAQQNDRAVSEFWPITARSGFPSPLKSPTATPVAFPSPAGKVAA